MSTIADFVPPGSDAPLPPPPSDGLWPISLEKYHEMIRQGILTEDDPVELWEGVLVQKMTKNRPHCLATELVRKALSARVPTGWHVESQESVTMLGSELEPDVVVVRGAERDYVEQNPTAADLALIVEVADSTLVRDRGFKKALYAKAGVSVYWIVNLVDRRVEVFTDPAKSGSKADYRQPTVYGEAENVSLIISGQEEARIAVRELLP